MTKNDIILRDVLALDRTKLANSRTLLSFIRTSLYLVVSGLAVMNVKVLEEIRFTGWILIAASLLALITGIVNYFVFKRKIQKHYNNPG
jgi:putative membrane protein